MINSESHYSRSLPSVASCLCASCLRSYAGIIIPFHLLQWVVMGFFIQIYLALFIIISLAIARPGRSLHHGADHFHQPREQSGGPFAGIEVLSTPSELGILTVTRTSWFASQSSVARPTGPTTYISVGSSSIGPIPVTIIPVPIATKCSSVSQQTIISTIPLSLSSSTLLNPNSQEKLPAAATALLRLNSTEADDASAPIPTFTAFDGRGCSTLYTRTSSAICSTVLSGLGSLPVSVTDCGQLITFSTSTGSQPGPTATIPNHDAEPGVLTGERLAYFVAPWYDITAGKVPSSVLVHDCGVKRTYGEACATATESWRVVNRTMSVEVTRSVAFEGSVTGVSSSWVVE